MVRHATRPLNGTASRAVRRAAHKSMRRYLCTWALGVVEGYQRQLRSARDSCRVTSVYMPVSCLGTINCTPLDECTCLSA